MGNSGSSLSFLLALEEWMDQGVCHTEHADPSLFILDQGYTAAEAKKYCDRCPVREECAAYARRTRSVGVWGGKVFSFRAEVPDITPTPVLDNRPIIRRTRVVYFDLGQEPGILGGVDLPKKPGILG